MTLPERIAAKPIDPEGVKTSDMMWAYMQEHFPAELAAVEEVSPYLREGERRRKYPPGAGLSTYRQKAHERTHYRCWALASTGLKGAHWSYRRAVREYLAGEEADIDGARKAVDAYDALKGALDPGGEFYGVKLHSDVARQVERTARSADHIRLQSFHKDVYELDFSALSVESFDEKIAALEAEYFPPELELEAKA